MLASPFSKFWQRGVSQFACAEPLDRHVPQCVPILTGMALTDLPYEKVTVKLREEFDGVLEVLQGSRGMRAITLPALEGGRKCRAVCRESG